MKSQTESTPAKNGFDFPACLFIAIYHLLWVFRKVHGSSRHNSIIIFIALHSLPLDLLIALSTSLHSGSIQRSPGLSYRQPHIHERPQWIKHDPRAPNPLPMESRGISPWPSAGLIPGEDPEEAGEISPMPGTGSLWDWREGMDQHSLDWTGQNLRRISCGT